MTEFVISSEQLERLIEGIEHNTGRRINKVVCDGTELLVIVRCRDCRHRVAFEQPLNLERVFCDLRRSLYAVEDEGFCAWGVRRDS